MFFWTEKGETFAWSSTIALWMTESFLYCYFWPPKFTDVRIIGGKNKHACSCLTVWETNTHVQMMWVLSDYGPIELNEYVQVIQHS